jgi:Fur family ferric uptake transcriptional regulator
MSGHTKVLESLKASGHRITAQRLLVLSALAHQPTHVSVEEIMQDVRQSYPYIDVATIYRTLQWLKDLHLVTEFHVGGAARFELNDPDREPHHHMVCRVCGEAFNLPPQYLEEFQATLKREFGFEPDVAHFAIAGRCAKCARGE